MYCRKCGSEISEDSKFCRKCGEIIQSNETKIEKTIKCSICGHEYSDQLDTCPKCKIEEIRKKRIMKIRKIIPAFLVFFVAIVILIIGLSLYFTNYHLSVDERTAVQETMDAINKLGVIDENSGERLLQAEILYARLLPKSQRCVKNIEILTEARKQYNLIKATNVIDNINAIGTISKESGEIICVAEDSYEALLDSQKRLVDNASVLKEAREEYDQLCAQEIIDKVDKIN